MPGAKIVIAKKGKDALTDLYKEMSLHSDLNLQKIVKVIKIPGGVSTPVPHGLEYAPTGISMTEVPPGQIDTGAEAYPDRYNSAGTYAWYCPSGVTKVTIKAWGAGGGGGGITTDNVIGSGGGGAGGQYATKVLDVTPGTIYSVKVGAGGAGSTGNGGNGGDTIFGSNLVVAKGGAGGKSYENGGTGGVGSTSGGVGTTVYRGGNGGAIHSASGGAYFWDYVSGEGGGSAGPSGNGGHALGKVYPDPGGLGRGGWMYSWGTGNGAWGMYVSADGFDGDIWGGGGSGGANLHDWNTENRKGGSGGQGNLQIHYSRNMENPRYFANLGGLHDFDDTNLYENVDSGENMWAYLFLDPAEPPKEPVKRLEKNTPVVKVYSGEVGGDYTDKINSYYDTLKVFKTGNLTVNLPKFDVVAGQNLEQVGVATFRHGLGYFPMYAPFTSGVAIGIYQDWLGQYYGRNNWDVNNIYGLKEIVWHPGTEKAYQCIRSHAASAVSQPGVGAQWQTYWKTSIDSFDWDDFNLNNAEDVKMRFGGVSVFNMYYADFYVTEQDLVLKYTRVGYDWQGSPGTVMDTLPAGKLSVDYTIFYNRADQEFDMLTS